MDRYEDIKALNWSSLRNMATSPLAYQWRQEHPREDTAALRLGRAVHCAILEPDAFEARYAVRPEGIDGRTKEGKAWAAGHHGLDLLSADEGATVEACAEAVRDHDQAHILLSGPDLRTEVAVTWVLDGVACKGRLDAVDREAVVDLKTTRDLGMFGKDFARLHYYAQLAWYTDGARLAGVVGPAAGAYIIAVETEGPHDVAAFVIPDDVLDAGRRLYRQLLDLWRECGAADCWPGRYPALTRLELPRWAAGAEADAEVW